MTYPILSFSDNTIFEATFNDSSIPFDVIINYTYEPAVLTTIRSGEIMTYPEAPGICIDSVTIKLTHQLEQRLSEYIMDTEIDI